MNIKPGALNLRSVSFAIGSKSLIDNISLSVRPGEMVGLLGPNGSGKSTLLRTIYRVNKPLSGEVEINGENVWERSTEWVARHIGVVLQDMPADFPLTVHDVVAMGRSAHKKLLEPDTAHDRSLVDAALRLLNLKQMRHRAFRSLSGGERQRTLVARALVQQPCLLVLDEPTNHLDIRHQLDLLRFVRALGITVIAALHDLNLAAMYCDRLCLIGQGKVIATGTPEAVLNPELISQVYQIEASIARHPKTGTVWVMPSIV